MGVVHMCQPGLGWLTAHPGDCLTRWHCVCCVRRRCTRRFFRPCRRGRRARSRTRALVASRAGTCTRGRVPGPGGAAADWLVAVDFVRVVAVVRGHDVEPDGQFPAAGQRQRPRVRCSRGEVPAAWRCPGAWLRRLGCQLPEPGLGDGDVDAGGQRAAAHPRWSRLLPAAASRPGDAVPGGVPVLVYHRDFPAGVAGAGRGGRDVTGHGRVKGTEEPVLPGPCRVPLQGG